MEANQVLFHRKYLPKIVLLFMKSNLGFSILNLSKLLMYEFHYKYIKRKYAKLLDSLVYKIEPNDVYEDFYKDKKLFDFNDYPQDTKFFDPVNKKVIGKMKEEFKGKIISEFVGLKSKIYSLVGADGEEIKMLLKTQDIKNLLMFCLIKQ